MSRNEESHEQQLFIQWTKRMAKNEPELEKLKKIFAIPNGGLRHIATASRLKLEGVKPGVPDLFFPVASRGFPGLFIEMKKKSGGVLSADQKKWRIWLKEEGYAWRKANGFEQAKAIILSYLRHNQSSI